MLHKNSPNEHLPLSIFSLSRQLRLIQVGYVHDGQFIFSYLVR